MKRIIAPTDFSSASFNAVKYAGELAGSIGGDLLLLNVVNLPLSISEVSVADSTLSALEEESKDELANLKEQLDALLQNKVPIEIRTAFGNLEEELGILCKEINPFAIVMNSGRESDLVRFFLGSNTFATARHTHFPVIVVPEKSTFKPIRSIALACDLKSEIKQVTVSKFKEWLDIHNASLDLVYVSSDMNVTLNTVAESVSMKDRFYECHPTFHLLHTHNLESGVNDFIKDHQPGLLAVIPKDRNFLTEIFHKSFSRPFLIHPSIPVLAIAEDD
jgi:nucleotide-binding universal stress UspA family protein